MLSDTERLSAAFAGRYRVEREIGAGGMATVYLAHDLKHDRDVALKVLRREVASVFGADRFAREIGIAGRLTHPNILPMFDSGTVTVEDSVLPFYVMPYVQGESLHVRLRRERQLSLEDTLRIVRDVGDALDFAHAHGIVHRDVKPENILLVGDRALLADFGIARAASTGALGAERLTGTGIAMGTPAYMSPEQAAADPAVDGRSDTYALAVMAYEMLAGEPPFTGVTPQAIFARQISGEVHPLTTLRPHVVTPAMDAAIRRALSPAPTDRFARTSDFVSALEPDAVAPVGRSRAFGGTRRSRVAALGAVAALLVIVVTLVIRNRPAPNDGRLGLGIMPFRALGGASEWSETLPDLLSTFLDGTPGVRVADPWALWRPLRPSSDARARSPDPPEAERLARRAGVRRYVMGNVVRSGERLDLTLRIYGVGSAEPVSSFTMNGSVDSTAQLAQRTAVEVLERVWEGANGGPSVPRMESVFTQSPDALKAYLTAREAMRRGLPDSANAAITRAISLDSTFALGLLEAVIIRTWVQAARGQQYSGLRELAERALASRDSMSERQRLRLAATLAALETDGLRSATAWQQLLERDSTDLGATNGLSYVSVVYGWQYGATLADMLRAAERAVQIDSTDGPALFRRAQVALATWDVSDVRRQLTRLKALNSDAPLIRSVVRGIEALLARDQAFDVMVDSLAVAPIIEWTGVYRNLRAYRPDRAVVLTERTRRLAPPQSRDVAVNALVAVLGAAGDLRAVDSIWSAGAFAALGGPPVRLAQRIVHAALLGVEDSALTTRALKTLADYVPIDSALAYFNPRPVWSVSYTLGAWHAQRGDSALARRWLDLIAQFAAGGSPRTWRESIAADIASRLAQRRGNADSARALAARAFDLWTIHTENTTDADLEPAMRFRYAQLLLDAGLRDSAARILWSFIPPTSWLGSYVPPAHIALGGIAEQSGDLTRAAQHYDQALQLLALGGSPVAAQRALVEAALRRTAREPVFRYGRN